MIRVFYLIFINLFLYSELILEITESANQPVKIAVLQKNDNSFKGQQIVNIISNDLKRTGEFEVLSSDQLLSIPLNESEVIQRDWLLLDVDSIIFIETNEDDNNLDINSLNQELNALTLDFNQYQSNPTVDFNPTHNHKTKHKPPKKVSFADQKLPLPKRNAPPKKKEKDRK